MTELRDDLAVLHDAYAHDRLSIAELEREAVRVFAAHERREEMRDRGELPRRPSPDAMRRVSS